MEAVGRHEYLGSTGAATHQAPSVKVIDAFWPSLILASAKAYGSLDVLVCDDQGNHHYPNDPLGFMLSSGLVWRRHRTAFPTCGATAEFLPAAHFGFLFDVNHRRFRLRD